MVFRIASSPYTHNQRQTSRIMLLVLLAAVPGIAAQLWFFGWGTLVQILLASVSALLAEALVLKLRKQSVAATLKDNSALLTGLLLAVSIPPLAPAISLSARSEETRLNSSHTRRSRMPSSA